MRRIACLIAVIAATTFAAGQSFNVDISYDGLTAPSDGFGAAAGQPGYWNNLLDGDEPGKVALKDISGAAPGVVVVKTGGGIIAKTQAFSGDFAKLISDYHYTNDQNSGVFYEIQGLEKGAYIVYAYANRPGDNGNTTTLLSIAGKVHYVTGTIQNGTFEKYVTHAVGVAKIVNGQSLIIGAMVDQSVGALSGFQIVKVPTAQRLYVSASGTATGDGTSWDTAFNNLYAAMIAAAHMGTIDEIWVANGVYYPTADGLPAPCSWTDRRTSFELPGGVKVIGGFAGTETSIDERDLRMAETILSGELGESDGQASNSYHVVRAANVDESAVLDGFTLSGGYADGGGDDSNGPGMIIQDSSPTVRNCLFQGNACADSGGAVYVAGASEPNFSACDFYKNSCDSYGGAMRIVGDGAHIPKIWNSRFISNTCGQSGGAINVTDEAIWVYNCVFLSNLAQNHAGAVRCWNSSSYFGNCTLYGNDAKSVGGIQAAAGANVDIRNSILYANYDTDPNTTQEQSEMGAYLSGSTIYPRYNCVAGWTGNLGGEENFNAWPNWFNPAGPDGLYGTLDDDVRLAFNSKCIDRGRDEINFRDWLDLDHDGVTSGEPTPIDVYGCVRIADDLTHDNYLGSNTTVDVGAAEFVPVVHGDMNCDGAVDFNDIDAFVEALADPNGYIADHPMCNIFNGDTDHSGEVDFNDIDTFVECLINGGC